jgi:hypothetical protein
MQPDLARYWEELRLVVAGPRLLAPERLLAIARLNSGGADRERDAYLRSLGAPQRGG